jgi:hydroxymethylglutaryl-CoA lyase
MEDMASTSKLPSRVSVYEVSPRDGLQNEGAQVATHAKVRLVDALVDAGITRIEIGSFVAPKWVPQMSDADEVCRMIERRPGVTYAGLCPNARGLERALAAKVDEIAAQTLKAFEPVIGPAVQHGLKVRGYVSTMWGCPYEGDVDPARGLQLAKHLLGEGCYQISLGDTIGVGTPVQTQQILDLFTGELPVEQIALHLHDTRGTALANVLVGLQAGVTTFDASVAGLGEDLVYTLHGMGIETGIDLDKLWQAGQVAEAIVGRELPGKVHRAGVRSLAK